MANRDISPSLGLRFLGISWIVFVMLSGKAIGDGRGLVEPAMHIGIGIGWCYPDILDSNKAACLERRSYDQVIGKSAGDYFFDCNEACLERGYNLGGECVEADDTGECLCIAP